MLKEKANYSHSIGYMLEEGHTFDNIKEYKGYFIIEGDLKAFQSEKEVEDYLNESKANFLDLVNNA